MRIDEMNTDDFRKAVKKNPIVILPIGATEAHGPHLPLGTDTIQPEHLAASVSERMENVLIAPTLPYGLHSSMKDVPGTLNITFDTLRSVVYDILQSLANNGVKKVAVMSGHAGSSHICAITEACRDIVTDNKMKLMMITDFDIAVKAKECKELKDDGHAGMVETSRILAIRPELVNDKRPVGKYVGSGGMILEDAGACFPDGIAGDTRKASAETGAAINTFIIDTVIEMIRKNLK